MSELQQQNAKSGISKVQHATGAHVCSAEDNAPLLILERLSPAKLRLQRLLQDQNRAAS
jgi:hypothetical protein